MVEHPDSGGQQLYESISLVLAFRSESLKDQISKVT